MAIVIVTKNQYVLASKIHHVSLNEHTEWNEIRNKNGKVISVREVWHNINVLYTPDNSNNPHQHSQCDVAIRGRVDAYKVYKNLIDQIREQCPDELFLNKALERLLSDQDFEIIQENLRKDELSIQEIMNDRRSKKVRRTRKAKRASKAVLRKSNRGRSKRR